MPKVNLVATQQYGNIASSCTEITIRLTSWKDSYFFNLKIKIMKLKEKFKERLYNQSHDDSECLRIKFENIDKVIDSQEQIADEFAIGFAYWCEWRNDRAFKTYEELLEIYKKEKVL